jgi:hypothetical protein
MELGLRDARYRGRRTRQARRAFVRGRGVLTRQLSEVTGPILEPATGTGRILIPLLETGPRGGGPGQLTADAGPLPPELPGRGLDPVPREAGMTTFVQLGGHIARYKNGSPTVRAYPSFASPAR